MGNVAAHSIEHNKSAVWITRDCSKVDITLFVSHTSDSPAYCLLELLSVVLHVAWILPLHTDNFNYYDGDDN